MRTLKTLSLLFALGVILAHSAFPHHHHVASEKEPVKKIDHHHHIGSDKHHEDNSDQHDHGIFTFNQIEEIFLSSKKVVVPLSLAAAIGVFEWSPDSYTTKEPIDFFIRDIDIPPLLRCLAILFRGPPLFGN